MTDNRYHNGKIYRIISTETDKVYYGSTTNKLWSRFSQHKAGFKLFQKGKMKKCTATFKFFEKYGIDTCRIILVENYKCENRDELLAREQYYIDNNKDTCINNYNAHGINIERKKTRQLKYIADNKETINDRNLKNYYERKDRPEYIEARHARNKKWRENNKEFDKKRKHEWGQQLYHCSVCNTDVKRYSKSQHEKSEKHKRGLENLKED